MNSCVVGWIKANLFNQFSRINAPMLLAHDVLWKSTATFVSDKNGIIDISQTPSCSGSYEDIATMGLFFNAKPYQ